MVFNLKKRKGQGSMDFLLLVGGGVLISVVIIAVIIGMASSGRETAKNQSDKSQSSIDLPQSATIVNLEPLTCSPETGLLIADGNADFEISWQPLGDGGENRLMLSDVTNKPLYLVYESESGNQEGFEIILDDENLSAQKLYILGDTTRRGISKCGDTYWAQIVTEKNNKEIESSKKTINWGKAHEFDLNATCDVDHLYLCDNQTLCNGVGTWYNNVCYINDDAACLAGGYSFCTSTTCPGVWYNNACYASEESLCNNGVLSFCNQYTCPPLAWYNNTCYATDAEACLAGGLTYCTSSNCVTAGGYWYNNTCNASEEEVCDATHLNLCTNQTECEAASGYWWSNNTCRDTSEPVCSPTHLDLCTKQSDCENAHGYWWSNDTCHDTPESTVFGINSVSYHDCAHGLMRFVVNWSGLSESVDHYVLSLTIEDQTVSVDLGDGMDFKDQILLEVKNYTGTGPFDIIVNTTNNKCQPVGYRFILEAKNNKLQTIDVSNFTGVVNVPK